VTRRINVISRHLGPWTLRQTPGRTGLWGGCKFEINASSGTFDGVVVYDDFRIPQTVECPPDALVFVTGEPPAIKTYHAGFLAQFHRVVTPHSDLPHPRLIDSHCGMPWHAGLAFGNGPPVVKLDYDDLVAAHPPKTRLLSVIASHRNVTEGHRRRPALVAALRARFGDDVVVFGRESQMVADKWEAIAPFKYHVALENSRLANYWTEKLADTFLADAHPIYWGSSNIDSYFQPTSLTAINIFDVDDAISRIAAAIHQNLYETARTARADAREAVLKRYNFFAVLESLFQDNPQTTIQPIVLLPESTFRDSWGRKLRKRLRRAVPRRWRSRQS
jgi:hypothetical protein